MGAPTNLSDQGAGEMNAAARMHAEPVMHVNQLTRWYILTAIVLSVLALLRPMIEIFTILTSASTFNGFLMGAFLMFFGGIGIKFLPSSLGGNPHVYSIGFALATYWLILGGSVVHLLSLFLIKWGRIIEPGNFFAQLVGSISPGLMILGTVLMGLNFWNTMRNRV